MCSLALVHHRFPRHARKLVGAVAICGMGAMLSVFSGVHNSTSASGSRAAPESKATNNPDEAPTGFNNSTNGFEGQDVFDKDRQKFEEVEAISDGLGPVYNATSCVSCHQS